MLGIHDYWAFVLTGILLNLTPGQDTFFILGRSLAGGPRVGVAAALGITAGSILHTLLAALGLSALLATSSIAFAVVKWLGAAYLLYLGVRLLLEPAREIAEPAGSASRTSTGAAFRQGMLTNLLNPKVALFFLALMPQFIAAESPHKVLAFLALGATFVTTGTVWCLCLALASGQLRRTLLSRPALGRVFSRVAGGLFIALGVRLALARR